MLRTTVVNVTLGIAALAVLVALLGGCAGTPGPALLRDPKDDPNTTYVFILAGQSNMAGAGKSAELFDQLKKAPANKAGLSYNPDGTRSWRWGFPPMLYPTHSLGFLTGVTGEWVRKVSCLGWRGSSPELTEHPFRVDNVYNNPFWSQASMMLTDRDHMCRCNVFWRCMAGGERAQWFGDQATLYMPVGGVHGPVQRIRDKGSGDWVVPQYWKSDMLPERMRHASGHGGSAVFISAEFINALLEEREPECDLYDSLAMTVPGIVAHQSALQRGEQLPVPQFGRPKA